MKQTEPLSKIKKVSEISPVAGLLVCTAKIMPLMSILGVMAYILIWLIYNFIPWRSEKWEKCNGEQVNHFKKVLRVAHIVITVLLLGMPTVTMLAFQLQENGPVWLEHAVRETVDEDTKIKKIETVKLQTPAGMVVTPNTYIGCLSSNQTSFFEMKSVLRAATCQNLLEIAGFANMILIMVSVGLIAFYVTETIGEILLKIPVTKEGSA